MKKSYVILLLILSFGFVMNVNAKDMSIDKETVFKEHYYTDFFIKNDKFYLYPRTDASSFSTIHRYDKDFLSYVSIGDYYNSSILHFDDYYFVANDDTIKKYDNNDNVLDYYTFDLSSGYPTLMADINEQEMLVYQCYYRSGIKCSFHYLDHDLNFIKTVDAQSYPFSYADFFGGSDNKSAFVYDQTVYFLDKDLNVVRSIFVDNDENAVLRLSDAKVFDEDELLLVYKEDNCSNKVYVYRYDLEGNLKWKKVYESSIRNIYDKLASITLTEEGNYIVSNGSFVELTKDGKEVNSCSKCSLFSKTVRVNDIYYGANVNLKELFRSNFYYDDDSVFVEAKFKEDVKLTIKDSENGRVRVNRSNPHVGEEVIITLRPQVGYEYGDIKLLDKDGKKIEVTKINDKKYSFIVPAGETTIDVTFKKINK